MELETCVEPDGNKIAFSRPVLVSLLGKCNQFVCWLPLLILLDNKDARFNLEPAGRKCLKLKPRLIHDNLEPGISDLKILEFWHFFQAFVDEEVDERLL